MSIIKNYFKQNRVTHTFSSCQWPIGDPQEKDFHFCEADTLTGKPYCKDHCDVAYIDERELKKKKKPKKSSHRCLNFSSLNGCALVQPFSFC